MQISIGQVIFVLERAMLTALESRPNLYTLTEFLDVQSTNRLHYRAIN